MFRFIKHHPRLFLSILVGILVFLFLPDSLALHTITRLIVAWNAMAWLYLILASLMIKSTSHAQMKLRSKKQNEGKYVVLSMVVIAAIVIIGIILFGEKRHPAEAPIQNIVPIEKISPEKMI